MNRIVLKIWSIDEEEQTTKKPKRESNPEMNSENINIKQGHDDPHKPECKASKSVDSQRQDIARNSTF